MGNNSPKSIKRKHIYNELNKKIDSFNSKNEYPLNFNEIGKKKQDTLKLKYKIKKRKKIETDLKKELIESSIIISDFLNNNLISKETNRRALPDTNVVNSLLLIPDIFEKEKKGIKFSKQIDYCEQIISKGINDFKKEYIKHLKNNKSENINNDKISIDYKIKNNITNNENEYNNINNKIDSLKGKNDYLKKDKNKELLFNNTYDFDKGIRNSIDDNNNKNKNDSNISHENNYNNKNHNIQNYLYKPKKIKNFINLNNKIKNKFLEDDSLIKERHKFNEANSSGNLIKYKNKIYKGNNKRNFIGKKIYLNKSPKIKANINSDKEDIINLKNINNNERYIDSINNTEIYSKINDKIRNNNNTQNKRDFSVDNIKKRQNNEIKMTNEEIRKRIMENNLELSKTQENINKKDIFNGYNKKEKNFLNLRNKDNNINISPFYTSENKIEKSANFNIIKNRREKNKSEDSLFNIKNNIELKSEYRKSKKFFKREINTNQKLIENLSNSSLKDYVSKQAHNIRKSLDNVKNKENEKNNKQLKNKYKNNGFNDIKQNKINNIKHDSFPINGADYIQYNLTSVSNRSRDKDEIKRKNINIKKNNNKSNKRDVLTIDLRNAKSYDKYKK